MTYILGIHCSSHDSSVCLLRDGELVGFAEEERFNRIKHTVDFPEQAIAFLLNKENITLERIDYVAFPTTDSVPLGQLFNYISDFGFYGALPLVLSNFMYRLKFRRVVGNFKRRLNKSAKVLLVGHHVSHLANGFLISPFKEAAILTIDGR